MTAMLAEGKCLSPNIDYGDAVRALLAARVWTSAGDWACGRCSGPPHTQNTQNTQIGRT